MSDRELDRQLVERAQRGDKHAFELLVIKYQRKLARLLSRFIRDSGELEDVTQEAFIKAYRALPSFRGDSAFYTWLYRIGINTAKNYLVALLRTAIEGTDGDEERIRQFHGSLSDEQREAIALFHVERLSHAEIAARRGISESYSRALPSRALARLAREGAG